ncbi:MAG: Dabb family protein [Lachnospiraceae bacterium]|nr:Dabb family protein [Lachnospiraceae bacterium]
MVKHYVMWNLKKELSDTEKEGIKSDIRRRLENLKGVIPGIEEITVYTEGAVESNSDIMLECILTNREALTRYQANPEHQKIRNENVAPYVVERMSFDVIV